MPGRKADTHFLGSRGEDYAERLLIDNGYEILQRNYSTKVGEIDIIAKESDVLVFVEVKLRKTLKYGYPEASVTPSKLKRIKNAGLYYCNENKIKNVKMRIDVVSILMNGDEVIRSKVIKVIEV